MLDSILGLKKNIDIRGKLMGVLFFVCRNRPSVQNSGPFEMAKSAKNSDFGTFLDFDQKFSRKTGGSGGGICLASYSSLRGTYIMHQNWNRTQHSRV